MNFKQFKDIIILTEKKEYFRYKIYNEMSFFIFFLNKIYIHTKINPTAGRGHLNCRKRPVHVHMRIHRLGKPWGSLSMQDLVNLTEAAAIFLFLIVW